MSVNSVFSCGKKVVTVEDEEIVSMMLESVLMSVGYEVDAFSTGEELLDHLPNLHPDLILMDVRLDGNMDGIETAEQVLAEYNLPIVFLTAYSDDDILQRIIRTSPYGYLTKPFRERELLCCVEVALCRHRMERALQESEERYRTLFDYASDPVYLYEIDESGNFGRFIQVNTAAKKRLGYSDDEFLCLSPWDIYDDCCRDDIVRMIQTLQREGAVRSEMIHTSRDGSRMLVDVSAHCFPLNGRQVVLSICREHDV